MQVYGRRAEKRLLWLTFSAIAESENRAAEIAIGPAVGRPDWNDLRNTGCVKQLCRRSPCRRWFHAQSTSHQRDENRLPRPVESVIWDGF